MSEFNRHHVLFPRVVWTATDNGKQLRSNASLIPSLESSTHAQLHREVSMIPLMDRFMLRRVARLYQGDPDPLESIDKLMSAIQEAKRHPRVRDYERNLGEIAVWCLELQKPYIAEGTMRRAA